MLDKEKEIILRIKRLMKERNINQEELALKLGIKQYQVSRYLNLKPFPPLWILFKLSEILDASIYYLIGEESESYRVLSKKSVQLVDAYNSSSEIIRIIIDKILDI